MKRVRSERVRRDWELGFLGFPWGQASIMTSRHVVASRPGRDSCASHLLLHWPTSNALFPTFSSPCFLYPSGLYSFVLLCFGLFRFFSCLLLLPFSLYFFLPDPKQKADIIRAHLLQPAISACAFNLQGVNEFFRVKIQLWIIVGIMGT